MQSVQRPWLNRLGFDRVKDVILNETQQTQLFQRIMEAKEVVQAEPWQQISSQEKKAHASQLRRYK